VADEAGQYTRRAVGIRTARRRTSSAPTQARRGILRAAAWGAVAVALTLPLARRRFRLPAPVTVTAVVAGPIALAVATPRSRLRDAGIYALQMWAFIVIHELPHDDPERLEQRIRVDYPLACDRLLGLGTAPTLRLQRVLGRPGRTTRFDRALVWVHWLWFLEPHAAAAWILLRHPARFPRAAVMLGALFHLGATVYVLVPTAPPWWAAEEGKLPGARRIMVEVGRDFWGRLWRPLYDFLGGNPVAAMPSLHFATSVMAARMLDEAGPVEGAVGWAYAGTLGFGLVYLGEHYVIDLLAGLALAEGIRLLGPRATPVLAGAANAIRSLESRVSA
jgi:membrane-associated phospholipid phosphatase